MKMEQRTKAIDKIYKRRDRIEMPDFQREEVWLPQKKKLLIDTILREWHLPKFYFCKLDNGTFECVDGQQRLSAIFEFFNDDLVLNEDTANRIGAKKYSELDDDLSDLFDDFEIDIEEIVDASEEDLEELFKRLQLGTPLNTAEMLNAIRGEMRDFCHDMAKKSFLKEKVGMKDTRYSHFEAVVKWACIEARGINPVMGYPHLESLLKDNRKLSRSSSTAIRISNALDFLEKAFPDKCKLVRNRANTLSICMLAGRVYAQKLIGDKAAMGFRDFVETFFKELSSETEKGVKAVDHELMRYQAAITSGSTSGASINARINILTKRLSTFSSIFSSLLGAYDDAKGELSKNLIELAASARDTVYAINRKYSARQGKDLFKMTTKSSAALDTIKEPCDDIIRFGDLVDALYFLIYEGSGSCYRLSTPPPEFAMDVKFLRTAIRHDHDHGSASEVKKKLIHAGEVFEKYSGKKTPEECGPEEFLSTQVRILRKLIQFLNALSC